MEDSLKILTNAQLERYRQDGVVYPVPVLSLAEARSFLDRLDALETSEGAEVWKRVKMKPHLLVTAIADLARHPRVLDAVEDIIGPDIMLWAVGRFSKPAGDPAFVSWHQDGTYWGLSEPAIVTAWVALTPSTTESGCMRIMPGSHHEGQQLHADRPDAANMLSRGQEIAVEVDEAKAIDLVLQRGEISLHHPLAVHGSGPNRSGVRRVGIAIRYVAPQVCPAPGFADSATLVRGEDRFGHFEQEPTPGRDFDPAAIDFYDRMVAAARDRKAAIAAQIG